MKRRPLFKTIYYPEVRGRRVLDIYTYADPEQASRRLEIVFDDQTQVGFEFFPVAPTVEAGRFVQMKNGDLAYSPLLESDTEASKAPRRTRGSKKAA